MEPSVYSLDFRMDTTFYAAFGTFVRGVGWVKHERFRRYICPTCKKFDVIKALHSGLDLSSSPPKSSTDVFYTSDDVKIVNERARRIFEAVAPGAMRFHVRPGWKDRYAVEPLVVYGPPITGKQVHPGAKKMPGKAFRISGKRCPTCSRYSVVTFDHDHFSPGGEFGIVAAVAHPGEMPLYGFYASPETAARLRAKKPSGLWIRPVRPAVPRSRR